MFPPFLKQEKEKEENHLYKRNSFQRIKKFKCITPVIEVIVITTCIIEIHFSTLFHMSRDTNSTRDSSLARLQCNSHAETSGRWSMRESVGWL